MCDIWVSMHCVEWAGREAHEVDESRWLQQCLQTLKAVTFEVKPEGPSRGSKRSLLQATA
eukprot:3156970-Amphidinium_carterae.1